jgi:hypothetical protein
MLKMQAKTKSKDLHPQKKMLKQFLYKSAAFVLKHPRKKGVV